MINGSFVFGLDEDNNDVFERTVEWGIENGITTSTYHILTPYPGTKLYQEMETQGRLITNDWSLYDTRHVVYKTKNLSPSQLEEGYNWAYEEFYRWPNIVRASLKHESIKHMVKHFMYTGGWKKFEAVWNFLIKTKGLNSMLPLLETVLSKVNPDQRKSFVKNEISSNSQQPALQQSLNN